MTLPRPVVAAFLVLLIWPLVAISTPYEYTGIITYVNDGDTYCVDGSYYCAGGLQVRAADIDCPELSTPEGIVSRNYANQLLLNKRVYLDIDDDTGTDPYGRWTCIVYLSNPDGSVDLSSNFNRMLVDSNHACIWDFLNNEFSPSDWWGGYVPAEACLKNGNRPPGMPSRPSGPGSGYTGMFVSYSTSATDPDHHKVKYTFDWGDGTTSQTGLVNSGTIESLQHTWSEVGSYKVKAMATDSKGASSGWSSISTVSITALNRAPATPTVPSGPTAGVSGTAYSYSTSTTDPDGDQVKYTFNWEMELLREPISSTLAQAQVHHTYGAVKELIISKRWLQIAKEHPQDGLMSLLLKYLSHWIGLFTIRISLTPLITIAGDPGWCCRIPYHKWPISAWCCDPAMETFCILAATPFPLMA